METSNTPNATDTIELKERECENPKCSEKFFARPKSSKKYCSNKCRVQVQRVSLNGEQAATSTHQHLNTSAPETRNLPARMEPKISFPNFPEAAQYIIGDLKEKVNDLKDENKKLSDKYEALEEEYAELEETLATTKGALEKKPGALAGLFESPEKLVPVVTAIPEVLRGIKELFKEMSPTNTAIAGVADEQQQKANDILAWLASKPLDVQQKFVTMIQDYSQLADDELMDYVDYTLLKIHRQAV